MELKTAINDRKKYKTVKNYSEFKKKIIKRNNNQAPLSHKEVIEDQIKLKKKIEQERKKQKKKK